MSVKLAATVLLTGVVLAFVSAGMLESASAEKLPFFLPYPQIDTGRWYISNGWSNGDHQSCEWRREELSAADGTLKLSLTDKGGTVRPIGCAELHSKALYGFGVYEARLKAAAGKGLNSAFFTYIGPPAGAAHDEIDFEFLGKDPNSVSAGYFVDGKSIPAKFLPLGFDASADFHDYAIEWTPLKIRWYVDRKLLVETPAGAPIPALPGNLFFSLWSGSKIEDSWLGHFDYIQPKAAEVAWTAFTPPEAKCLFRESVTCP